MRWKGSLPIKKGSKESLRMTSISHSSQRNKTSSSWKKEWLGFTKSGFFRRLSVMLVRLMHTWSIRLRGITSRIMLRLWERSLNTTLSITQRRIREFWRKMWLLSKRSITLRWSNIISDAKSTNKEMIQMQELLLNLLFLGHVLEHRVLNWWSDVRSLTLNRRLPSLIKKLCSFKSSLSALRTRLKRRELEMPLSRLPSTRWVTDSRLVQYSYIHHLLTRSKINQ